MKKIILDINRRPGQRYGISSLSFFAFYVGISRVELSENMRILPPQPRSNFDYLKKLKCDNDLILWKKGYEADFKVWRNLKVGNVS